MKKTWIIIIFTLSFLLLALLKQSDVNTIKPFYKASRVIKLENFAQAKKQVKGREEELLELWESILTGRSAPLAKWMKERYQDLGLSHLFTPSGFHISAVLLPFMKILKHQRHQFYLLIILSFGAYFLPGMAALKRMLLIKTNQKMFGFHAGFVFALLLDILFGSFQTGALSFTYSFLFIGIIYAGFKGPSLILWFFIGQSLLAYFQENDLSPLFIIFSPLLNFFFGLAMPLLFILAIPLWKWQLQLGLFILHGLQSLVDITAYFIQFIPVIEVHLGTLAFLFCLILGRWKLALMLCCFLTSGLNLDRAKSPGFPSNEFIPQGEIIKVNYDSKGVKVFRSDGNCKLQLVRGFWWENCSPKRRSRYKKT